MNFLGAIACAGDAGVPPQLSARLRDLRSLLGAASDFFAWGSRQRQRQRRRQNNNGLVSGLENGDVWPKFEDGITAEQRATRIPTCSRCRRRCRARSPNNGVSWLAFGFLRLSPLFKGGDNQSEKKRAASLSRKSFVSFHCRRRFWRQRQTDVEKRESAARGSVLRHTHACACVDRG